MCAPLPSKGSDLRFCPLERAPVGTEPLDRGVLWSTVVCSGARRAEGEVGPVFLGTHQPRLDDKGRLFLPARFRDELAEGLVITKGQERCLYVFPLAEWGRITEGLRAAPVTGKSVRDFGR